MISFEKHTSMQIFLLHSTFGAFDRTVMWCHDVRHPSKFNSYLKKTFLYNVQGTGSLISDVNTFFKQKLA